MADSPDVKKSGRYRKVEVRTWGDEKFRALSALPPSGQGLWLYLITGPHTGPIPGLFRAGRAAMAEDLDWEVEAFDKAFGEVFRQGMVKADFKARVMWVPNAIKHNRPESPNVVRSWAAEFDLIPECDLKREAYGSLKASIHALGEAFAKAFDESFGKPSAKPSPKAIANQEQEQEQEQKKDQGAKAPLPPAAPPAPPAQPANLFGEDDSDTPPPVEVPPCPHQKLLALFGTAVPELPQPRREMWEDSAGAEALRQRWKWLLTARRSSTGERYASSTADGLEWFKRFFETVGGSDFLTGRNGKWKNCDLTWLMKRENFRKVVEGHYVNKETA